PCYENYAPDAILSDAKPRYVPLRPPDWCFDRDELRAAFNPKTKAIIICNPNNPTGKVFTRDEMEFIAGLCQEFDALCFTDEIYEHILYPRPDAEIAHISMAQLDGMRDRTVIVNSMSKTYSVTGWRVGYCIASPEVTSAIRKVHDFLTVGAEVMTGSSFYRDDALGAQRMRFCFFKKDETLMLAAERLKKLRG